MKIIKTFFLISEKSSEKTRNKKSMGKQVTTGKGEGGRLERR